MGFDCATKLTAASAKRLKDAGFNYAARYLGNSWKTFNIAEAKAIQGAGLKLISIFQKSANYAGYHTEAQGVSDAKEAERYARAVGQPEGSAIYFAVDFAAQPNHMQGILNYLKGVKKTLKGYKVGLYGSYAVMQAVKGHVDYYWQTYAWSGGKVADFIHMHQYHNDIVVAGVAIDRNSIKKSPGHWGSVQESKPAVKPVVKPDPKPITNTGSVHTVKSGDTLSTIAAKYKTTVAELVRINGIKNPDLIRVGQKIKLPESAPVSPAKTSTQKAVYHTVKHGDTVSGLAVKFKVTQAQIKSWNNLKDINKIYVGQKLRVK